MAIDSSIEVLIVGAGPTGLVLALWLTRLGVQVRIIDKTAEPGNTSRALAIQARTLELYAQIGLANAIVERGRPARAVNLWVGGNRVAHADLADMGTDLSPFPNPLIFPQDEHERMLVERLGEAGVEVERQTTLVDFADISGGIRARLQAASGSVSTCDAAYIAGCDGARSAVREGLKIGFPGGTYQHLFYVADVEAAGEAMNGALHVGLDKADFLAVFPLKGEGRARLVGTVREDSNRPDVKISWEDVGKRVIDWMHIDVRRVNWFSTYRVHHRVADRFRNGSAFLLGDAAHIHSPVGGQGMNTGIGDAINLAWKIASVLRSRASGAILDTYETERIAFARRLVATTDRAFTTVTSTGTFAQVLRLRVVPILLPLIFAFNGLRRIMFRTVSQTGIQYRTSALSEGQAGRVHGGDRLPWAQENFDSLRSLDWQVHVYGVAPAALKEACATLHLALHAFNWHARHARAGFARDAYYLVRPDGYVALAAATGSAAALTAYCEKHGLSARR